MQVSSTGKTLNINGSIKLNRICLIRRQVEVGTEEGVNKVGEVGGDVKREDKVLGDRKEI